MDLYVLLCAAGSKFREEMKERTRGEQERRERGQGDDVDKAGARLSAKFEFVIFFSIALTSVIPFFSSSSSSLPFLSLTHTHTQRLCACRCECFSCACLI